MQSVLSRVGVVAVAVAVVASFLSAVASGQSVVPSADQIEMLRNLTPEQRDALMGGKSGGGSAGSTNATKPDGRRKPEDQTNRRKGTAEDEEKEAELEPVTPATPAMPKRKPVFKADDSVLIEMEIVPPPGPEYVIPSGAPAGTPPILIQPPEAEAPPDAAETERLKKLIELVRSRNPYVLDRQGALQLPGYPAIPLAGLTEEQAVKRLKAERSFRDLDVSVVRLPLKKTGTAALKPFGYDLFEDSPDGFAPTGDTPVPADYIVGPGDELNVQLYGSQNRNLRLVVGRDGRVRFPELGPISVGGQSFQQVRASLESRVKNQLIGVSASVSMGDTGSIRVFVLGEAKYPGSYSVSGLATVTTALFAAGGIKSIGSLRDVQLKRQGAVIRRLDLYDLLLRGDTSNDAKLQPGDAIFIPPVGATITVDGEVRRPAIYELKLDAVVSDALELAGGLNPEADAQRATLDRVDEQGRRVVLDVDLAASTGRMTRLRNGDSLRVSRIRPQLDSGVLVQGHLHSPGAVAWREGLRLSDVIPSVDDLKPNADLGYVLVRRELPPDRRIVVLSADLSRALRDRGGEADLRLSPRDQITVFDLESGRQREIERLLEELRLQSRIDRPTSIVRVGGRVKVPGDYPLEPNMTVSDLIRAGGNLADAAYGGVAELARYSTVNGETRRTELVEIDLAKVLMGDKEADLALRPFDYLSVKGNPELAVQEQVKLLGEVRFPGTYPIKRGETLRSVLERAGGLTDRAFAEGAVFTRKELREREQKQLDILAERLRNDVATMPLQSTAGNVASAAQAASVGQSLLSQLKSAKAMGRLVIDLKGAVAGRTASAADVVLQDGDALLVPKQSQEVTVIGEVQNATSHLYRPGLSRDDYISLSGNMTRKADDGRIYVVRADGSVVSGQNSKWFSRGSQVAMRPGDTVVVPLDTERLPTLPLWQAITQIIYNLAIGAAAVNSF